MTLPPRNLAEFSMWFNSVPIHFSSFSPFSSCFMCMCTHTHCINPGLVRRGKPHELLEQIFIYKLVYIDAHMWNLEKWYRRSYLQRRNRDTDLENKCMGIKGKRRGGRNWEFGTDKYTLLILCTKQTTNESLPYSTGNASQSSVPTQVGRKSKREGYMHTYS